jgi:8-oxo-dGTP diphosphatase
LGDRLVHRVVAAVIERDGRYLIAQRLPKAVFALHWEFPGGKVEPGEDDATALRRELVEELAAEVEVGELLEQKVHSYREFDVDFRVYRCGMRTETPKAVNVADFRWVTLDELGRYRFPPADESAIARLAGPAGRSRRK